MNHLLLVTAATFAVCLGHHAPAQVIDPQGPLQRVEPRLQDMQYQITLWQQPAKHHEQPIEIPLIVDGPWSMIDPSSLTVEVWGGGDLLLRKNSTELGTPDAAGLLDISLAMPKAWRWPVVIRVSGLVATWSSTLDESLAGQVPWPAAWPGAVSRWLQPSPLIASDDPTIKKAVSLTVGDDPRAAASPLAVAKRLIQASCTSFQLDGAHLLHGPERTMRGINASGAVRALARGGGTRADLVCLCTAVLRSAGIPARPVLCIGNPKSDRKGEFDIRAEFFIPEAGWVPYDPDSLRRRGIGSKPLADAWRDLGNSPDLNRTIALSWSFAPGQGGNAYEAWAPWSWARLAPDEPFPLDMHTGSFRHGDNVLITGSANLHSRVDLLTSSRGRPETLPPSPWRGGP